jgi:cytochrome P450
LNVEMKKTGRAYIAEIREKKLQGDSLMHHLIYHSANLSDEEIMDELICMVMAGHETTANTLSFAYTLLAACPEAQTRAREELKKLSFPLEYADLQHLPYVHAIFRETLRMFPTLPFVFRVAKQECICREVVIPKDSVVIVNMQHMCHNEAIFEKAGEFRPERWLNSGLSTEELRSYEKTRNFGWGARVCVGKRFAEEEGILLIASVLRRFEIKLVTIGGVAGDEYLAKNRILDIPSKSNVTTTLKEPVSLRFVPLSMS